jgi:hypothetical protein
VQDLSYEPLTLAVVAEPPDSASFLDLLSAIAAWPDPERIVIVRRLVRARSGVSDSVSLQSNSPLGGANERHEALRGVLAASAALRTTRPAKVPFDVNVAVITGVGTRPFRPSGGLLRGAAVALEALPVGSGMELCTWRRADSGDVDEGAPLVLGSPLPGYDLQLTPAPPSRIHAAFRVWTPGALAPQLLAQLAAAVGLPGDNWQLTEDVASRVHARDAIQTVSPPQGSAPSEATSLLRLAALLASPHLTPARRGAPRLGRPWPGKPLRQGAELGRVLRADGSLSRLSLPWEQRRRHVFVAGRTGSGKSELLARLAASDLEAGRGLVLLDPHGDLAERVLGLVPADRERQVVLVEPCDERSAAIPVLDPSDPPVKQIADLEDVFIEMEGPGLFTGRWRRPGTFAIELLNAVGYPAATPVAVDAVMSDDQLRLGMQVALAGKPLGRTMGQRGMRFWDQAVQRGAVFAASPGRYAFDQPPRWSLDDALGGSGIVIVRMDMGRLGTADTRRFGGALLRLMFNAIARLGRVEQDRRPELSVIVDEAHVWSDGPVLGAMLAQLRKFGASLTLCSQAPSKLGDLLPDVITNCGTVMAMQLPEREARALADRDATAPERLPKLPRYHATLMLDEHLEGDGPHVLHPLPPLRHEGSRAERVAAVARDCFGREPARAGEFDLGCYVELADRYEDSDETGRTPWSTGRRIAASADVEKLVRAVLGGRVDVPVGQHDQTALFEASELAPAQPGVCDGSDGRLAAA